MARRTKRSSSKTRVKVLRPVEALLAAKANDSKASEAQVEKASEAQAEKPPKDEAAKAASTDEADAAKAAESPSQEAPAAAPVADATPAEEAPRFAELIPPRALPKTSAGASAPPPGVAPPGDSRSFRRMNEGKEEFCLLYRFHRQLIIRRGPVGNYGAVEVIDYPTEKSAAHAYANKCSDLSEEGFYDLRG